MSHMVFLMNVTRLAWETIYRSKIDRNHGILIGT